MPKTYFGKWEELEFEGEAPKKGIYSRCLLSVLIGNSIKSISEV